MICTFTPPTGADIDFPSATEVSGLILNQAASYWESGSGTASIRYSDDNNQTIGEIIFLLRETQGVYIQLFLMADDSYQCFRLRSRSSKSEEVTVDCGGAPLTLPQYYFVDRQAAANAIGEFIEKGQAHKPVSFHWELTETFAR
jgi:hypothetical protein